MTVRVAILAFEHVSPFHLSVPCMVFSDAARSAGVDDYVVQVCSEGATTIESANGFQIVPQFGLDTLAEADIVILPSWSNAQTPLSESLLAAIHKAHDNGAMMVGLCLGAYALATAGLLDSKSATTHWAYMEDFKQRFPKVRIQPDVLYQQDGNIITSAGTAAAIDCCLHIVREALGTEKSNRIARLMVTAPHRSGGQAQYIELPIPTAVKDRKLAELLEEIRLDLSAPYTIDLLAERMLMSRRTFTRHFKALTGDTVGQWILDERLRYSQTLLEQSKASIEQVSQRSGFNSVVSLRHHFRQRFGVSPSDWRKTFCAHI